MTVSHSLRPVKQIYRVRSALFNQYNFNYEIFQIELYFVVTVIVRSDSSRVRRKTENNNIHFNLLQFSFHWILIVSNCLIFRFDSEEKNKKKTNRFRTNRNKQIWTQFCCRLLVHYTHKCEFVLSRARELPSLFIRRSYAVVSTAAYVLLFMYSRIDDENSCPCVMSHSVRWRNVNVVHSIHIHLF